MKKITNCSFQEALFCFFPLYEIKDYFKIMLENNIRSSIIGYNHLPVIVPHRVGIFRRKGETFFGPHRLVFKLFSPLPSLENYSEQYLSQCSRDILLDYEKEGDPIVWSFGPRHLMLSLSYQFSILGYKAHFHTRELHDKPFIIAREQEKPLVYPLGILSAYRDAS